MFTVHSVHFTLGILSNNSDWIIFSKKSLVSADARIQVPEIENIKVKFCLIYYPASFHQVFRKLRKYVL